MKDKKLQVFVSSTYTDLKEERQAAVEAILSSGNIPAGMELFSAGDESQMTVIERWIDESDVYLLILGGRYGSVESKSGKSYTHLEYEYALKQGKPLFAVVISERAIDEKVTISGRTVIEQDNTHLLKDFRAQVTNHLVKFWDDKKDIKIAIHETLAEFSYKKELIGWIRGDNAVNTGALAEEIARLTKENAELRDKLSGSNSNGSTALYSGLNYQELRELLKRVKINVDGIDNLFNWLAINGEKLAKTVRTDSANDMSILDRLLEFKLVSRRQVTYGSFVYNLTDDGHNFYLKSLLDSEATPS